MIVMMKLGTSMKMSQKKKSRNAVFCDLLWPLTKMDEGAYSRRFNVQMIKAMGMFHQGLLQLAM